MDEIDEYFVEHKILVAYDTLTASLHSRNSIISR